MNWDTFFDLGESITADEARQFISSSEPGRYQLVDVRQPREYEMTHIPGAILVPLPDLPSRLDDLDTDKPAIVYCRSGVRSRAACQILIQADFKYVFNMSGGILTWQGAAASGDEEAGLDCFVAGDFDTTFALAIQMETGLKRFYQTLAGQVEDETAKRLLARMAQFEHGHVDRLLGRLADAGAAATDTADTLVIEGGLDGKEMLALFGRQLGSPEEILHLAMRLEAQAFDLYCRLARKHHATEDAAFYREMAHEEQLHLSQLGAELDGLLQHI